MVKALCGGLFLLGIASCATTNLPPVGKAETLQLEEDERGLWRRSEEEQKRLARSSDLYDDSSLVAYVNEVAQGLIPENVRGKGLAIEVRVVKNPLLNAFTYPNGAIYIHTGILAKMENEAQLATLLAHEMTHATHRHAVQSFRSVKNTTAAFATFQVLATPFGVYGGLASLLGAVGAMAAVTGYSRELEAEADREGLELLVKVGYDPEEAPKLFAHLKRDLEEQETKEPFFFGTHPRLQERIDNYTELLKGTYAGKKGEKGAERFTEKILPLLIDNALFDLSMGRFDSARRSIDRFLQRKPQSARGHYCLGEIYRQRGKKGDGEKAEEEYLLAAQYDPPYPDPHKGLGLIYYKQGLRENARTEFERYLSLAPQATDRGYIEQYLNQVKTK